MDFLTQQIIALRGAVNRLTSGLRDFREQVIPHISGLSDSLQKQSDAITKSGDAYRESHNTPPVLSAELQVSQPITVQIEPKKKERKVFKSVVSVGTLTFTIAYTVITAFIFYQTAKSADAAKSAADTARDTLVISQRPWVKIKHRIIKPLTFNVPGNGGPIDSMTVEDTLEDVGQGIALNVFSWEDVIPIDADNSLRTAYARRDQWCDASRHRDTSRQFSGYMLFPKDPFVQYPTVGGYMKDVNKIAETNNIVRGKAAFVLIGCVCYKFSFEKPSDPFHETKFLYRLGIPQAGGGIMPFVVPSGTARDLQLVAFPDGFSAD